MTESSTSTSTKAVLEVRGFSKRYGARAVLVGVDLAVNKGETLAVIGKSGCGKSTLLRHMATLEDARTGPVSGEIRLEGRDLLGMSERAFVAERIRGKKIGMVFQAPALFDFLSVERNVTWPLIEVDGFDKPDATARAKECLALVDLPTDDRFLARDPAGLSGGERKRVSLARTLALRPEVVLYDEPTTGLDPPTTGEVVALVNRLKERAGITAVLTSHDMSATLRCADRIAMIRDARVVFSGTAAEAEKDAEVRRFMHGEA
jgi:phospholipid/cholesterol/gamma-HCH transport system ATP-binding protein